MLGVTTGVNKGRFLLNKVHNIGRGIEPLEGQAYMEIVCYQCATWPQCQASNLEDCKRRDDETDAKYAKETN